MLVPEGGSGDVCVVDLYVFVSYVCFVGYKCWDSWPVTEVTTDEWKCLNLRQPHSEEESWREGKAPPFPLQTVGACFTLNSQKETSCTK